MYTVRIDLQSEATGVQSALFVALASADAAAVYFLYVSGSTSGVIQESSAVAFRFEDDTVTVLQTKQQLLDSKRQSVLDTRPAGARSLMPLAARFIGILTQADIPGSGFDLVFAADEPAALPAVPAPAALAAAYAAPTCHYMVNLDAAQWKRRGALYGDYEWIQENLLAFIDRETPSDDEDDDYESK